MESFLCNGTYIIACLFMHGHVHTIICISNNKVWGHTNITVEFSKLSYMHV